MPVASTSLNQLNSLNHSQNRPSHLHQTGLHWSSSPLHPIPPLKQKGYGAQASASHSRRTRIGLILRPSVDISKWLTRAPLYHNSNEFLTAPVANQQAELGVNLNSSFYSANGNKVVYWNNRYQGQHPFQCTEYAYGRALEKGLFQNNQGIGTAIDGNAGMWDDNIRSTAAYANRLSYQPRKNSIVVWEANQAGAGTAGHVGFVEETFSDGSFLVSEGNWNNQPFHLRLVRPNTEGYNPTTPNNSVQFIDLGPDSTPRSINR